MKPAPPPARLRTSTRPLHALALALAAPALTGCWGMARLDGGVVVPTAPCTQCSGSTLNAHLAVGEDSAGMDLAIRTKYTPDITQVAFAAGIAAAPEPNPIAPYFAAGIHTLQFESAHGAFAFGMFSPYAELGLHLGVSRIDYDGLSFNKRDWISVLAGASIEYDIRFTDQPSQAYWSFKLGMAFSGR